MKKMILGTLFVGFAALSQACTPCCTCGGADTESLFLLLAGEKTGDDHSVTYVSAEETMEAR